MESQFPAGDDAHRDDPACGLDKGDPDARALVNNPSVASVAVRRIASEDCSSTSVRHGQHLRDRWQTRPFVKRMLAPDSRTCGPHQAMQDAVLTANPSSGCGTPKDCRACFGHCRHRVFGAARPFEGVPAIGSPCYTCIWTEKGSLSFRGGALTFADEDSLDQVFWPFRVGPAVWRAGSACRDQVHSFACTVGDAAGSDT